MAFGFEIGISRFARNASWVGGGVGSSMAFAVENGVSRLSKNALFV